MTRIVLLLLALLWSQLGHADMPLSVYQNSKGAEFVKAYVTGVGRGMFWLNAATETHHRKALFCIPPKISLDEPIIHALLDQEIRAPASGKFYGPDVEIELIMYNAVVSRFPCTK